MDGENSLQIMESIIKRTNKHFIEKQLRPFLRIPSTTLNKSGIEKAKKFLISYLKGFSEQTREFDDGLVLAEVNGNTKKKLLIYMMYDTQPITNAKNWISKPFGAEIKILPPPLDVLGNCIIARGAYNSKTPLLCFLNIVKLLKERKELPLSLTLLFDAQEEIGSPFLLKFLKNKKQLFKNCVDAYYPSIKQDLSGNAVLKLGYKGILSFGIRVYTNNKEPHSAFSGMIPNPPTELISLINLIYSNYEFLIGSLKKPYILSQEENMMIDNLMKNLDIEDIKNKAGIIETVEDDPLKCFIGYLFKPTFNISTLKSGFLEKGIKNMVANQASCNIDIRFAHDISVDKIYHEIEKIVNSFQSKCHIELVRNVGYNGSRVKKDSILVKSLIKSFEKLNVNTELWPLSAAAAPLSRIKSELGLDFITGGLGIGGMAHAPNEFVQMDSIKNTRLSNFYFLDIYLKLNQNRG